VLSESLAYDSEGKHFCRDYASISGVGRSVGAGGGGGWDGDESGGSDGSTGSTTDTSIFEDEVIWQAVRKKAKTMWHQDIFWCPARVWGDGYVEKIEAINRLYY
jgi:hypothetical protein